MFKKIKKNKRLLGAGAYGRVYQVLLYDLRRVHGLLASHLFIVDYNFQLCTFKYLNRSTKGCLCDVEQGTYKSGETIAVKLFHSRPGLDHKQFELEFLNLASLQHKNIVRLVGFCHDTQKHCVMHEGKMIFADEIRMALCFEYMPNGSLANYLCGIVVHLFYCTIIL
jgi:serine/threonine protein kinase